MLTFLGLTLGRFTPFPMHGYAKKI
jgi:hypothetical protein